MRTRPTRATAVAACLAVLLAVTGCTQLPRPFQPVDKGGNALLRLPDRTGVAISPVTGAVPGDGQALAGAMAEALRTRNIPTSVGSGNSQTRWLLGHVDRRDGDAANGAALPLRLTWELYDADGERLGTVEHTRRVPDRAWRAGESGALGRAVRPAAAELAAMIQGRSGETAALPGYPEGTRVIVGNIRGEPDAAGRALAQAMASRLRQRDLPVADRAQPGDVVIDGELSLGESNGTNRPLELVWIVRRAGSEGRMGDLRQANRVADARIRRGWDRLAGLIARAATPGVLRVIEAKAPGR